MKIYLLVILSISLELWRCLLFSVEICLSLYFRMVMVCGHGWMALLGGMKTGEPPQESLLVMDLVLGSGRRVGMTFPAMEIWPE
jgi:hypothetical protein